MLAVMQDFSILRMIHFPCISFKLCNRDQNPWKCPQQSFLKKAVLFFIAAIKQHDLFSALETRKIWGNYWVSCQWCATSQEENTMLRSTAHLRHILNCFHTYTIALVLLWYKGLSVYKTILDRAFLPFLKCCTCNWQTWFISTHKESSILPMTQVKVIHVPRADHRQITLLTITFVDEPQHTTHSTQRNSWDCAFVM